MKDVLEVFRGIVIGIAAIFAIKWAATDHSLACDPPKDGFPDGWYQECNAEAECFDYPCDYKEFLDDESMANGYGE